MPTNTATAPKIQRLSPHVINQIAAGEVIENAASVVKELVDNAIDAHASQITIELEQSGRELIRVCDNGLGMTPEDLSLSIEPHATSKLSSVEDLDHLLTLGFRGEAIPSIASVSKMKITSCPRNEGEPLAHEILIEGGRVMNMGISGVQRYGTTVEVRQLFFNAPVRQRFQKSLSYDLSAVENVVVLFALAHPEISFYLFSNGKPILELTASQPTDSNNALDFQRILSERIARILGIELFQQLLPVQSSPQEDSPLQIRGFIGSPQLHRSNRKGQYLIVNRRAVHSSLLSQALKEAYYTTLPQYRFPFAVLHFDLPPTALDVNVHPQKSEVRFANESELCQRLLYAVEFALNPSQGNGLKNSSSMKAPSVSQIPIEVPVNGPLETPVATLPPPSIAPSISAPISSPNEGLRIFKNPSLSSDHSEEQIVPISWKPFSSTFPSSSSRSPSTPSASSPPPPFSDPLEAPISSLWHAVAPVPPHPQGVISTPVIPLDWLRPLLLGYIHPYLLLRANTLPSQPPYFPSEVQGIAILNVPGARSRLLYEESCALVQKDREVFLQNLLTPISLSFSIVEARIVHTHLDTLLEMGFHLRSAGPETYFLDAIPPYCHIDEVKTLLLNLIAKLQRGLPPQEAHQAHLLILAHEAARSITKSSSAMGIGEEQQLIERLFLSPNPFYSPLGHPLFSLLSMEELERRFKK